MKLSIAWIFDHINADWKDVSISELVEKFNTITAEIENVEHVTFNLEPFTCARVTDVNKDKIILYSDEWKQEISLSVRDDAKLGMVFLITKDRYATVRDLGCNKDGFVPALVSSDALLSGEWKKQFEVEDYILEIDNKSITHRPDMWSHRGFAREIAALLDVSLKSEVEFLTDHPIKHFDQFASATKDNPFSIEIKNKDVCTWFSGLYIESIASQPSSLWMAHRVARTDNRPINIIIDATNYVLLDFGQPMHAFDVKKIGTTTIVPRMARNGETLTLLDGDTIELTPDDLVISNGDKPMALAGIMGGHETAIDENTSSLFIEAARFNAATIRRTATRFKKRTESSARFEKSLDAQQTVPAILRFLKLLRDAGVTMTITAPVVAVGHKMPDKHIEVSHDTIETLLGCTIQSSKVIAILKKLEFGVREHEIQGSMVYMVTVPSFRATKDIELKEDLVEEVGRFHGYTNIKPVLPSIKMQPADMRTLYTVRKIKQHMAYAGHMHEVSSYALYDEAFLQELAWEPTKAVTVFNPVSDNWKRLVTSLIPHLLRTVNHNATKDDELRFFEWNSIWPDGQSSNKKVTEHTSLAAILYKRKQKIDFYEYKAIVQSLFDLLGLEVQWTKIKEPKEPWYGALQTAQLLHDDKVIGYAGMVDETLFARVTEGYAFVVEVNGDYLTSYRPQIRALTSLSKYQDVSLDISMLAPSNVTVKCIADSIKKTDSRITRVRLIDFFEKKEWKDQRSLTFRFVIQDHEKTLDKRNIDTVLNAVVEMVTKQGVVVR